MSLGDGGCLWGRRTVHTCHQWLIVFWGPAGFRGPFGTGLIEWRSHVFQGLVNYLKQMKNLKVLMFAFGRNECQEKQRVLCFERTQIKLCKCVRLRL